MKKLLGIICLAIFLVGCSSGNANTKTSAATTTTSEKVRTEADYFDESAKMLPTINKDNYKSEEYGFYDYKSILREPKKFIGVKIDVVNLEIIQLSDEGKYKKILAMHPSSDLYMLFIQNERIENNLLKGDTIRVNGRFVNSYKYTTKNDGENIVPLIYIDAYSLKK